LTESRWQRLARIRDETSEVAVLVLNDDEVIQGLVVLITDHASHSVVFTNVAGVLDLQALSTLGEHLEVPGLEDLEEVEGRAGDD
jgi:hypothetical protein